MTWKIHQLAIFWFQDQVGLADVIIWGSLHPLFINKSGFSGMYCLLICFYSCICSLFFAINYFPMSNCFPACSLWLQCRKGLANGCLQIYESHKSFVEFDRSCSLLSGMCSLGFLLNLPSNLDFLQD